MRVGMEGMALYASHQNTMASDATTINGARQPSGGVVHQQQAEGHAQHRGDRKRRGDFSGGAAAVFVGKAVGNIHMHQRAEHAAEDAGQAARDQQQVIAGGQRAQHAVATMKAAKKLSTTRRRSKRSITIAATSDDSAAIKV